MRDDRHVLRRERRPGHRHVPLESVYGPLFVLGLELEGAARVGLDADEERLGEHGCGRAFAEGTARDDTQLHARGGNPRQRRLGMMAERGIGELVLFRERDPGLQALQARARAAQLRRGALRMNDAVPSGHPVDIARCDRLHGAEAVTVQDFALEQIGDRRQAYVRMRAHVDAGAWREIRRTHVIEKDERADHAVRHPGEHSPHRKPAEVAGVGFKQKKGACAHEEPRTKRR